MAPSIGKSIDVTWIFIDHIDHITKPTNFVPPPPGIEPGISGQRSISLATMLYRRGLISCPTGRTGGAVPQHSASQPSPGFEPPPTECETRRIPFIYRDDTDRRHSGGPGGGGGGGVEL